MDPRRVLIVESQNEFALSLAAVLRSQGYQTAHAGNGADAQREIEKRRPDLVVLRAELPDISGFSLCGQLKKQREPVPIVLMSSDAPDAFAQHQAGPTPADGYLAIPFQMEEFAAHVDRILLPSATVLQGELSAEGNPGGDSDIDNSLNQGLGLAPPPAPDVAGGPPPMPKAGPPKLPKRERRSALTDDDKQFLERVFGSIADRKAELLAEAKSSVRRPGPRRDLLSTPEGKLQLLREEVKSREAQIARLSEIWAARERELLSVEDRLHDKDVETQGLKMQIDDLLRRFNEAQEAFLQKEKEHGATLDDLLLQRFSAEKDLIEVVAAKEKDINALKRELNQRDDELSRRAVELDTAHQQYERLDKQFQLETLQGEMREKALRGFLARRETEIEGLERDLGWACDEISWVREERDARIADLTRELKDYEHSLSVIQSQLDLVVHQLVARAEAAEKQPELLWDALTHERSEREVAERAWAEAMAVAEDELFEAEQLSQDLRKQRDGLAQSLQARIDERQAEIERLKGEVADKIRIAETRENELSSEVNQKLERIGELEGEAEAMRLHLEEREKELNSQVMQLIQDLEQTQADLEQHRKDLGALQQLKRDTDEKNAGHIAQLEQQLVDREHEHEKTLAAHKQVHAEELATHKQTAQARFESRETELNTQIEGHLSEQTRLREQIGNLEGELANLQNVRSELEQYLAQEKQHSTQLDGELHKEREARAAKEAELTGEVSQLHEQVGNLQGELESLKAEKIDVEHQLAELGEEKAQLDQVLADTQNRLASTSESLAAEQTTVAQLNETLTAVRTESGGREARLVELQGELAATEQALHSAEERLQNALDEGRRKEELLKNDLTGKNQTLNDAQRKLAALAQEKQRKETELRLELDRRAEAIKNLEAAVQSAKDDGARQLTELDRKRAEVEQSLVQMRDAAKKLQAQGQELQRRLEQANSGAEQVRKDAAAQQKQRDDKIAELSALVTKERAERRKAEEDSLARLERSEARVKDALGRLDAQKAEAQKNEGSQQQQLAARTKKVQEMELALENAQAARSKLERDVAQKTATSEARERELTAKLQQAVRLLKESEGKVAKAEEEALAKAKAEIDRRDQARAAEIQRLQASLQEKSKALKVAELEVGRLKSKVEGATVAAISTARPPSNTVARAVQPTSPVTAGNPRVNVPARPPSDFEATSMMNRENLNKMLAKDKASQNSPLVNVLKDASIDDQIETTVVMKAPVTSADANTPEDDWTSVVDGLEEQS
jgi:chromosome segregation ATPase/DNA-binding NarL/FixJ family response regulator